jgi:hypothetical protein
MTCSSCGGLVLWMGPLTALTHTQCLACGSVNCQDAEVEDDAEQGEGMEGAACP